MERQMSIPISVVVERTAIDSAWQSHVWRPTGVIVGNTALEVGTLLRQDPSSASYFAGTAPLQLFPTDVESYRTNLAQNVPRLYVVLSAPEDVLEENPPALHLVTAAPDEAESYLDGDGRLVDGVPMGPSLIELVAAYVAEHPSAPPTGKRRFRAQRESADPASRGEGPMEDRS